MNREPNQPRATAPRGPKHYPRAKKMATAQPPAFSEFDWCFTTVPDSELVACCHWEYARESAFIRGLRQRNWDHWRPLYLKEQWWNAPPDLALHQDLQKAQSIGYASEVFLRGISCPPDGVLPDSPPLHPGEVHSLTGSFPRPWLELVAQERAYRSQIGTDATRIPLVPFERGLSFEARDIADWVEGRRKALDAENQRVREQNPGKTEEYLCSTGKLQFPDIRPSLTYESGCEVTLVRIHWGSFTSDEIVNHFRKWVKANRPSVHSSPDGRGRKLRDWRVALERLGMMRLLHHYSLGQMPVKSPKAWKLYAKREWYKERKRARAMFHQLFPFLPATDQPISWRTKGGRSNARVGTKSRGI